MKRKFWMIGGILLTFSSVYGQQTQEPLPFKSEAEKFKWVNEHPEEYKKLNGENVIQENVVPVFNSDAEKAAYMSKNNLGSKTVILEEISGFPKYIDTGNPEVDKVDYAYRKDLWIEQNKELYEKITKSQAENLTREQRLAKEEIIIRH